jgi:hypothetical protein
MIFTPLKIHSLAAHTMKFAAGITLQGFAENDACECARNADSYAYVPGADGQGTRYDTMRRDGRATFFLMSSSAVNAQLAAIILADEQSPNGLGVGALYLRNRNGSMVVEAEQAWIIRPADIAVGVAPKARNWIIETNNLRTFPGA